MAVGPGLACFITGTRLRRKPDGDTLNEFAAGVELAPCLPAWLLALPARGPPCDDGPVPHPARGAGLTAVAFGMMALVLACDPTLTPVTPPEPGDGGEVPTVRPSSLVIVVPSPRPTEMGAFPPFAIDTVSEVVLASGLGYTVVRAAAADAAIARPGDAVRVHYTGWLANRMPFDSSRTRGAPFSFTLGQRRVIAGWEQGVAGMRVGEWRKLVIPPALGYGQTGTGKIPPGAILIFEVELLGKS